ncbi:MAG: ATP-binding protein [Patescibacteria group bacterium]
MAIIKQVGAGVLANPLTLPTELSTIVTDLSGHSVLIYSEPKAGKTSLCAQFPDNMFFMFEPGAKSIAVYQREVRNWTEFQTYIGLVEQSGRFKTVTIDTIDVAYTMCMAWVCKENGWEHASDGEYGKGWNAVRAEFSKQINRVLKLGRGVIFTSHAVEKDIKSKLGDGEYTRIVPTMSGQARDICEALVDIWIYMYHEKGQRMMRIRGNEQIAAGHRLQGDYFKDLEVIPAGNDAKTAYTNLTNAFHNKPLIQAKPIGLTLKK